MKGETASSCCSSRRAHFTNSGVKYWAFLSYSHTDRQWGDWLHKALETYRVPKRLIGQESRDGKIPARVFFAGANGLPIIFA